MIKNLTVWVRVGWMLGLIIGSAPPLAQAAQTGKVIVNQADVHEFPQSGSRVIARVKKDATFAVSNVPTEGFYKARISTGQIGWISGNDLFVSGGSGKGNAPVVSRRRGSYKIENTRLLLGYGLDMASNDGLGTAYNANGLSAKSFMLEAEFRLNQRWFWALRAELHSGSQPDTAINASTTQTITQSIMPIQIGANYNAYQGERFRIGLGVYLGMAISSSSTVTWTTTTQVEEVKYSSMDPVGTLTVTGDYAISEGLGALLELGYRYHKTGEFPATTHFGGVSGFAINYSGITVRAGLELKL